jgi:Flp pilus assembly protein TadD
MSQDRTHIIAIVVLGMAITLGVVVAVWLILPRPSSLSPEDLYQQGEQQRQTGDLLGAEQKLRQAAAKAPDDARVFLALGKAQIGLHQTDQAQASFEQAAKLSPSRDLLCQSGLALLQSHQENAAESFFQNLVRLFPRDLPALYQLGALQSRKGRYAEAAATFEKIVAFAPNEAEAWNNLGFCYHNLGRSQEAIQAVQKALALNPNLPQAKRNLEIINQDVQAASSIKK